FDGRWGAGVIQQAVGGDILPVLNNLFCFCGFCLAMVALAKYWELPKITLIYTVFGLFIMLLPYTYPWLQYVRSETHFWNILLIVLASSLADKKQFWPQFAAFMIFVFSLGCYPATIETIILIFWGRCLLTVWFDNPSLKDLIKKYYSHVINIFVSFVVFILIFGWMKKQGLFINYMSLEPVTVTTLFQNVLNLPQSLKETFMGNGYYLTTGLKLLLGLSFLFVFYLMTGKSYRQNLLIGAFIIAILVSSQIIDLLSAHYYAAQLRLDFFAVPYIYALGWTIMLRQKENLLKNTALVLMMIATCYAGLQAFRDQKVKYFDLQREMKIYDDIRARIKADPKFDPSQKYNILMIGDIDFLWENTTFDHYNDAVKIEDSWIPYVMAWNAKAFFDFYEKDSFVELSYSDYWIKLEDRDIEKLDIDYLLHRAFPWPHSNSIYLNGKYIYIVLDWLSLNDIRDRLHKLGYETKAPEAKND
ncbi:MAG: hypothetical protein J6Y91_04420, partial [Alphaproteobacteria bacterium]|nr:hypothetical protein [Alphaproteobacteria bacterium]